MKTIQISMKPNIFVQTKDEAGGEGYGGPGGPGRRGQGGGLGQGHGGGGGQGPCKFKAPL